MPAKRQRRTVGAIVKILLDEGFHSYAQILPEADCVIFDARTTNELPIADIVSRPVLFRVAVYNHAFTRGDWLKVGMAPLRDEFTKPIPKFMQDILQPSSFSIYLGGAIRPASRAECAGLERSAVWEPEHVKSRIQDHYIQDHYNRVPNKWVESLRLK